MQIRTMIRNLTSGMTLHNVSFLVLSTLGLLLEGVASGLLATKTRSWIDAVEAAFWVTLSLGIIAMGIGCAFFAVGKGRSPWYGLLGVFQPMGLLFLCVLEDRRPTPGAAG